MPVGALELVTTADRATVETTQISERGVTVSMAVVVTSGSPQLGMLFVEAGLMTGGIGDAYKSAVLIGQYAFVSRPARWYGFLQMFHGDRVYLQCRASGIYTVRLNFRRVGLEG